MSTPSASAFQCSPSLFTRAAISRSPPGSLPTRAPADILPAAAQSALCLTRSNGYHARGDLAASCLALLWIGSAERTLQNLKVPDAIASSKMPQMLMIDIILAKHCRKASVALAGGLEQQSASLAALSWCVSHPPSAAAASWYRSLHRALRMGCYSPRLSSALPESLTVG